MDAPSPAKAAAKPAPKAAAKPAAKAAKPAKPAKKTTRAKKAAPVEGEAEAAEAPAKKEESKKFEDILKAKKDELKGDVAAAMSFCIKNHSSEYLAYRTRVAQGEIIKL